MHSFLPLGNWTCLSLGLSLSARLCHTSGREFCKIPGLCTMYEVFSEAFPEVLGKRVHAHFLSGNVGKYFKVTRDQDYFL